MCSSDLKMEIFDRLDIALTYKFNKRERFEHSLNFSVYNVYRKQNPFSILWVTENTDLDIPLNSQVVAKKTYLFDIVPAITYNFNF